MNTELLQPPDLLARPPDATGRFGKYGGRFVPETLMEALIDLENAYREAAADEAFLSHLTNELSVFVGRPTPLMRAGRLSQAWGAEVYLKREDLCHTGAHKINNSVGQALLTVRMGKRRVVAETGAGQHGVAAAAACARYGLECVVYMGAHDVERQRPNVDRMKLLGATVKPVEAGSRTLKDAINEALRDWVTNVRTTHYMLGSVVGPHPYPWMVRGFHSVIGQEARKQFRKERNADPDYVVACVGGGSNAMGIFSAFIDSSSEIVGAEAGGRKVAPGEHSATLTYGTPGVLHGTFSFLLQDREGQVLSAHSIAPGLDYPGVGPEHAALKENGRVQYVSISDADALEAFSEVTRLEGIVPALESSHALAAVKQLARQRPGASFVVSLSGRGDKDLKIALEALGIA